MIKQPKGTRDLLPGVTEKWHFVEKVLRETFMLYGYKEIRTPTFEHTELFARGVGEDTDIVSKEMYTFEDKKGRSLTLRPEGTASVMRAYLSSEMAHSSSVSKLYYMGNMYRYERPQKGRYREFSQYGAEILGGSHPAIDAELIEMLIRIVTTLGVKKYRLVLNSVGCKECRPAFTESLKNFLKGSLGELCGQCNVRYERNPLRMLDCKVRSCQDIYDDAPSTVDSLCDDCNTHFEGVKKYLEDYGVEYEINKRLVRGLDYYCKTAFELVQADLGAQDALVGGGRYDGLASKLGGKDIPSIGFAGGMERLIMTLGDQLIDESVDVVLVPFGSEAFVKAFAMQKEFRDNGISCSMDFQGRSIKAQLKEANKAGAKYALIIGEEELKDEQYNLKNMETGEQIKASVNEIIKKIGE